LPLVAVTVTFPEVANPPANIVSVDVAVPFEGNVTLVGLMDHVVHAGQSGGGGTDRFTVPEKPLRLVRMIAELFCDPVGIVRKIGLAVIAKSGCAVDDVKLTVVEWERLPLVPVTVIVPEVV
jgi:hypothetical protein